MWAAGLLKIGGRLPAWMTQTEVQEATPEDIRYVVSRQVEPAKVSLEALASPDYVVGRDRLTGKLLISGVGCLTDKYWDILKRGSWEECFRYAREGA